MYIYICIYICILCNSRIYSTTYFIICRFILLYNISNVIILSPIISYYLVLSRTKTLVLSRTDKRRELHEHVEGSAGLEHMCGRSSSRHETNEVSYC